MVQVRDAAQADCQVLVGLVSQLGYPISIEDLEKALRRYSGSEDRVLVAEKAGRIVGLLVINVLHPFHTKAPWGRVSALVVDEAARGSGVGGRLLEVAGDYCVSLGCSRIELTSAGPRTEAHGFYRAHGFEEKPKRFVRNLK